MKFDLSAWTRWGQWMDVIHGDLAGIIDDHALFKRFYDLAQNHLAWIDEMEGNLFITFVYRGHAARVSMGIRRHLKEDTDSISLVRLLRQMSKSAKQLDFDFYLEQFPREKSGPNWQRSVFNRLSCDGNALSATVIEADMRQLQKLASQVEEFADRTIAHVDRRGTTVELTVEKLDAAVAALDALACKYRNFLTGEYYSSLESAILFDWAKILRNPMFPSDG